ncbi:activating signal cointegrator 1 complex subunit 3 [Neurospora tetrasperma FGSC 2508]|uniref:Activating signal cointegrator 1 complex subunit 3 n=1 Tax=Neurospora tetrasperma (strain FGSC 2508 / ATCC MYA-4615 / P0657) TaxID=510951 RepID=F8MF92_NEUT8|nr:activating signal cointegrator 1 complex subunit 3 [Neurospora tetrasperma FGSC 2508]EGO59151.1 activating signal cointegrator 1 complex subunit 3 [Neurospora tetrasperma FGSC 2508]EGZ73262.1 activating signal cointegrator 1 complex subunit 3 [Neurospora tetrasperma FGSC 2509]
MAADPSTDGGLDIAAWRAQIEAMKAAVAGLPPSSSEAGGSTTNSDWDDDEIDSTYSPTRNGDGPRDIWDFISDDELDSIEFTDGGDYYHDHENADGVFQHGGFASGSGSGSGYDFGWLASRCADVRSAAGLGAGALQDQIMDILGSGKSEDELQSSLTDLVGFDDLDFVIDLLSHREELVSSVGRQLKQQQEQQQQQQSNGGDGGLRLLSKAQREAALRQRDYEHKSTPLAAARAKEEEYPHVYRAYSAGNTLSHSGKRYALPPGSERKEFEKYEEYTIPAGKTGTLGPGRQLVKIADMDGLCRNTFKGYSTLNRMQSLVYPVAYKTSENMLICAPTGAGKTDAAMLTILHTVGQYLTPSPFEDHVATDFAVAAEDFKIVYVAPMKALAAEITEKLGKRLAWLGIRCREFTGDMHLTKSEIVQTQIIVTTPEKWDVVTRKGTGDTELVQKVRLLIIDEVHMLHDERGAVLESLVARTARQVESTQSLIRIVGLSATLPNYVDVADFLNVNKYAGLFYFDASFRPVPLEQQFIGVKGKPNSKQSRENLDQVAFEKVRDMLECGHQVMVFVHSRKDTQATAKMLLEKATDEACTDLFDPSYHEKYEAAMRDVKQTKAREIRELIPKGLGIHHAGMARADRNLMERLFAEGVIKVLCCTATLAWGVNLPAAAVVIKGTQVYSAQDGKFVDLGILDVLQIFGRAGRPQFEDTGIGMICTTHDKLAHYLTAITDQLPIESKFSAKLVDNLNAEIALGTVTSIPEAVKWISYSYLFVRMKRNPMAYGIDWSEYDNDRSLVQRRRQLATQAARTLQQSQMIIFNETTEELRSKDIGRIASQFYIQHSSVQIFNSMMRPFSTEEDILKMIAMSGEFDNIQSRNEEANELMAMKHDERFVPYKVSTGIDQPHTKTNILLQAYISRAQPQDFALTNDLNYVAQQAGRICRALFMIALNRRWGHQCLVLLTMAKSIEKRIWAFQHPFHQFDRDLPRPVLNKLDELEALNIESMREMEPAEIGSLVNNHRMGGKITKLLDNFPTLSVEAEIAPLNRDVLRIKLYVTPDFRWNDHLHGTSESYYIWVENSETSEIYHHEFFILNRRKLHDDHELNFTIPLSDPMPNQIYVRAVSDRWLGAETVTAVSFQHLIRPDTESVYTDLLNLQPLPISALKNPGLEEIYAQRFQYFNPMQTQVFHTLYHTPANVLLGSPTGSGKTVACELAMWWAFRERPGSKVVYIAPMKALVRERVKDWGARLAKPLGLKLVELTGDNTPDTRTIQDADIIITTPEKWDGISRSWQTRGYVRKVSLVIIDEIHLLAGDRGPILEIIVSRMNYIASSTKNSVRLLGMSTACANATDLANWLGVKEGLFNFRHSVRPVPLELYIDGFPEVRGFCPLMQSMNRPTFLAILNHSPEKPVIVFVPSRRQTRLTAKDLINFCGMEDNPRRFLHMDEDDLQLNLSRVKDDALKEAISFGIGLHHAGLVESDRQIAEELFLNNKIQILVATSTLAWGVNLPAHLVVVKGTQFYDAKIEAYKDMDLTDVLQMLGRAGRPQFDNSGVARIFTQDAKKDFYKHFLHTGFPVESSLHTVLDNHLCAEVSAETIVTKQDALDYLTWTFFFRRLHKNPSYYGLEISAEEHSSTMAQQLANDYMIQMVDHSLSELAESGCVEVFPNGDVDPTPLGKIMSYYYLSHKTIRHLVRKARASATFLEALSWMSRASEYDELPVRHNEDLINAELAKALPFPTSAFDGLPMWDPHVKAFLLLQAHMARVEPLPITDYVGDQTSVLDQAVRIIQASVDVMTELGYLSSMLQFVKLLQCVKQARWPEDPALSIFPGFDHAEADRCKSKMTLNQLSKSTNNSRGSNQQYSLLQKLARDELGLAPAQANRFAKAAQAVPDVHVSVENVKHGELTVVLKRLNPITEREGRIYAPKFPKPQTEGWFVVVADVKRDEVVAVKRVGWSSGRKQQQQQQQQEQNHQQNGKKTNGIEVGMRPSARAVMRLPPVEGGVKGRKLDVLVVSDGYIGMEYRVEGVDIPGPPAPEGDADLDKKGKGQGGKRGDQSQEGGEWGESSK